MCVQVKPMLPLQPGNPSPMAPQDRDWDLLLTAETHNFPCAVAPFPGAETGAGGRMRDTHATGTGSIMGAGAGLGRCRHGTHAAASWRVGARAVVAGVVLSGRGWAEVFCQGGVLDVCLFRLYHMPDCPRMVAAGTAGYCTGNLRMDGYEMPWEDKSFVYPGEMPACMLACFGGHDRRLTHVHGATHVTLELTLVSLFCPRRSVDNLASPLQILIDASNGASDYGNKFGEPLVTGYCRTFGQRLPNGERREWIKPIMFSGGVGQIDHRCDACLCARFCHQYCASSLRCIRCVSCDCSVHSRHAGFTQRNPY